MSEPPNLVTSFNRPKNNEEEYGYRRAVREATEIVDTLKARLDKQHEKDLLISTLTRLGDCIWALRDKTYDAQPDRIAELECENKAMREAVWFLLVEGAA